MSPRFRRRRASRGAAGAPGSPAARRPPGSCGWSFQFLAFDLVGDFDDNSKPPVSVRLSLKTMIGAIGLRQTVANVRQTDTGGRLARVEHLAVRAGAGAGVRDRNQQPGT